MDEATGARGAELRRRNLRDYSRLARLARTGALTAGTPDYDRAVGGSWPTLAQAVYAAHVAQRMSPGFWRALRSESAASASTSSDELAAARLPLGDMPLIVLTAGRMAPRPGETVAAAEARHEVWRTMHQEIAALSTRGEQRTVEGAGHMIPTERPEVVIGAIEEVLALAQAG
jgi:pimeloyl-ACP methyl ester carboxylesterase